MISAAAVATDAALVRIKISIKYFLPTSQLLVDAAHCLPQWSSPAASQCVRQIPPGQQASGRYCPHVVHPHNACNIARDKGTGVRNACATRYSACELLC